MRFGWPFRRLGWKLTLSYTLVTVVTLLVVEAVVLQIQEQSMAEAITILIVDDHAIVRKGVRGYLEVQPDPGSSLCLARGHGAPRLDPFLRLG